MVPHASPLMKRRIVSHAPLQAAPLPSASSTAIATSARPTSLEMSGSSQSPRRRTGDCGAIRRASQTLTSTGTSIAKKPIPNSAICAQRRVWRTSRRSSASYHMTSVIRLTTPPSRPRTMITATIPPPISTHRRHGVPLPKIGRATGGPPPWPLPPLLRRREEARRPSSIGVTLRSIGRPSRRASSAAWRRWSSSSSLSNQPDIRAARTSGGSRRSSPGPGCGSAFRPPA